MTLVGSWLFCIQHPPCSVSFWCMLGGSVEVQLKNILYWYWGSNSFRLVKKVLKWVWPTRNRNRLLFIQIQTIPPSMHQKWEETIDIVCKATNGKLWGTNSRWKVPLSFKDNSIGLLRTSAVPEDLVKRCPKYKCLCYHALPFSVTCFWCVVFFSCRIWLMV